MIKIALLVVLVALIFGRGGQRTRGLIGTVRRLPDDYRRGKAQAADPVPFAKEVQDRSAPKDDV